MAEKTIGPYVIKDLLGWGNYTAVYAAYHPHVQRHLAIKVVRDDFRHNPTIRGLLKREAMLLGSTQHYAIVPAHDSGEENGRWYYCMRYVKGESLQSRLERETGLPPGEVLKITGDF